VRAFSIHLSLIEEEDGSWSAIALNLPGAGSCGDTEAEAVANATEAICGVLESYESARMAIPWKDTASVDIPAGAKQKWITVNA